MTEDIEDISSFSLDEVYNHSLTSNVDYALSKKTTLSFSGLASVSFDAENENNLTDIIVGPTGNSADSQEFRTTDGDETDYNFDAGIALNHTFTPQTHTLGGEVRYSYNTEESENLFRQNITTLGQDGPLFELDDSLPEAAFDGRDLTDETVQEVSAQLDYVRPVAGFAIETGSKATYRRLDNSLRAFTQQNEDNVRRTNALLYDEAIAAAYLIAGREVGKVTVQAGVRAEQALTNFELKNTDEGTFENDYFELYPTAFARYAFTQARSLKASYSRRVNRPRSRQLNPFAIFDNARRQRRGNPRLLPEFTDSFELSFAQFTDWGTLTLTPFYRRTTNNINRTITEQIIPDQNGQLAEVDVVTFENTGVGTSYGLETILSAQLGDRVSGFVNVNFQQDETDGGGVDGAFTGSPFGYSLNGNLNFTVRDGTSLALSGFYRSARDFDNRRIEALGLVTFAVQQKLLRDKATLSLRVSDPFNTTRFELFADDGASVRDLAFDWQADAVVLNFQYNFGQQGKKPRRERGGGDGGGDVGF